MKRPNTASTLEVFTKKEKKMQLIQQNLELMKNLKDYPAQVHANENDIGNGIEYAWIYVDLPEEEQMIFLWDESEAKFIEVSEDYSLTKEDWAYLTELIDDARQETEEGYESARDWEETRIMLDETQR